MGIQTRELFLPLTSAEDPGEPLPVVATHPESGALFMTLDDHEVHHARVLMDEIFGPENFLANITWEKTRTPEDTGAPFLENHTHVLAYATNAKTWRPGPSAGKVPTMLSSTSMRQRVAIAPPESE